MANNLLYQEPASSPKSIATLDQGGVHYQKYLLADPNLPTQMQFVNADGTAETMQRRDVKQSVLTPVVSNGAAYTIGDAVGGILQFPNFARVAGGSCQLRSLYVLSKSVTLLPFSLVFFDRTFTHPGDNGVWNPSDADALNIVGVLRFAAADDVRQVSSAWVANVLAGIPAGATGSGSYDPMMTLNGTDLFAALVTGAAPTLTSISDVQVRAVVERV